MTTTSAAIRDLCLTAVEALTPRTLAGDRFDRHREDRQGGVTFEEWVISDPLACLRRFAIRDTGARAAPSVMGGNYQRDRVTFEVVVAYPVINRYGLTAGRALEDVIDEDQKQIEYAIGPFGSATFGADTSPLVIPGSFPSWDRIPLESLQLLVGRVAFEFWRTAP